MIKEKVNFRIVENADANLDIIYPQFKEDFLNPRIHVPELKEKYDLSVAKYKYLRGRVLEETGLPEKPTLKGGRHYVITDSRYIIKHKSGKCTIYKTVDGYKKSFGTYPDFETAKIVRNKLVDCNWDMTEAAQLKKQYHK